MPLFLFVKTLLVENYVQNYVGKCQKWPINVTYLIHLATPGKCNTFDTSIKQ